MQPRASVSIPLVDGHTRLRAALAAGLATVFIDEQRFEDKRAALEYAIRRQRDRRNLGKAELTAFIARAVEALDRVKPVGRPEKLASREANYGKSAEETAEKIGTSRATVERVRTVLRDADEATKQDLRNGKTAVNTAYRVVREQQQARQDLARLAARVRVDHRSRLGGRRRPNR